MTKGLEPWASFSIRQFNSLEVVIDKIEELSIFPIWCLKCHLPQFNVVITIDFFTIVPRNFIWEYEYGFEWLRISVSRFVKSLPETTRAFPKFNVIFLAGSKKLPKFIKDGRCVDLIQMGLGIEYLLSCINGVSDDNDFRYVFFATSLADATSNNKKFCFCTGDKSHVMNYLDQRLVTYVNIWDWSGNVILDTNIEYYNCCVWRQGRLNSYII